MNIVTNSVIVIILLFCGVVRSQDSEKYRAGLKHKKDGEFKQAVNIWLQDVEESGESNFTDFPLGLSILEVVAGAGFEQFYDRSVDLYYSSLANADFLKYGSDILHDAEMILPILESEEKELWEGLIESKDKSIATKILVFWKLKDPTPTTITNERLIEHWERIFYSRKEFQKDKRSIYGTDDRGPIFVKYGNPFLLREGDLMTPGELAYWVPSFRARSIIETQYVTYPKYELWVYRDVYSRKSLHFLFAKAMGTSFEMINGIEGLIPARAFRGGSGFPPGVFVQLMYYSELASFESHYNKRYIELATMMANYQAGGGSVTASSFIASRNINKMVDFQDDIHKLAPVSRTETTNYIKEMTVLVHPARFLENDKNVLSVVQYSIPSNLEDTKTIINSAQIHDEKMLEKARMENEPKNLFDAASYFKFNDVDSTDILVFSARTIQIEPKVQLEEDEESQPLIYSGKTNLNTIIPLNSNPSVLEISDLWIGTDMPDSTTISGFDKPILPTRTIYRGDKLKIYLELYHLFLNSEGQAKYTVNIQLSSNKKRGFFKKLLGLGKTQSVSQEFSGDSLERTVKDFLWFDVSVLKPGEYNFEMIVVDKNSGQRKTRLGNFKIIE